MKQQKRQPLSEERATMMTDDGTIIIDEKVFLDETKIYTNNILFNVFVKKIIYHCK